MTSVINTKRIMVADLRKLATIIREATKDISKRKAIKCAQILTAAQGLSQLQDILKGVR